MTVTMNLVTVLLLQILSTTVFCQKENTRLNTLKYNILGLSTATYVNDILLTSTSPGLSLFYTIFGTDLFFYFEGTSSTSSLEIVFGSSKQHVYSIVATHSTGPSACSYQDLYYANTSASTIYTVSTSGVLCTATGATTTWDQNTIYKHPLTTSTLFAISKNVDIDIIFYDGINQYPQTIVLYDYQVCSGTCGPTTGATSCDGPQYTDCLSCKDPLKVAIHNLCIPREPDVLPLSIPGVGVPDQIWNKQQFSTQNTSLYYGFRHEQNLDFCYFRIIIEQATPTWIGFSFGTSHLTSSPATDMIIIKYPPIPFTAGTMPTAEDWNSISATTSPTAAGGTAPSSDTKSNYQVTQGGHDGSTKWDVTLVRLCDMNKLTGYDASVIGAYQDLTQDYTTIVSCPVTGTACTFSSGTISYTFGFVLGITTWVTTSPGTSNHHHLYPVSSINTPSYPAGDTRLVNQKYCPTCNSNNDCVGPELQDCTLCKPGYQIDPHYPSTGPGVCIVIIIPCHEDCATCTTSFIDGCSTCTDTTKVNQTL